MNIVPENTTFRVRNMGSIREGRFTLKPLTIFCGPNNSGKTWVMYSLYHCCQLLNNLIQATDDDKPDLEEFNDLMADTLTGLFNTSPEVTKGARFEIEDASVLDHIDTPGLDEADIFLMPAERNGLHLFFRELSTRRTALLHHASKENINIGELLRDVMRSRYAIPIAEYIDWLNNMDAMHNLKSDAFHTHAEQLKKDLAGGAYRVDPRTGSIEFKPYQVRRDGRSTTPMGLHMTSSTVKSLFGLWYYLEHQARPGAMLMIDEPELNIHPSNQRKIARLLAKLVNAGLNVTISTHSDYIVREFNSLIMLGQDKNGKLRKKHRYDAHEVLKREQVGAFLFDSQTIEAFEITPEDGIYATTFDEVITELNAVNDDIYYSLREQMSE